MDCSTFSFDLHVLGTPPALILSQDQTLVWFLLSRDGGRRDRLSTESIDKPYLVRSLETNLKHRSHDWHVQPVVKEPMAFSALGGAVGERRLHGSRLSSKSWDIARKLSPRAVTRRVRHRCVPCGAQQLG
jgi:hypothetical protein